MATAPLPPQDILFENAACGLLLTSPDGTVRAANTTFCRWLGYSREELIDRFRLQQMFTVGGRVFHHTHWAPLLQMQGSVAEVQMDMVHKDRHTVPMLINAVRRKHGDNEYDELAFFIATDRRKYEQELLLARQTAESSVEELRAVQQQLHESRDVLGLAMRGAKMGVWTYSLSERSWWWSHELEALLSFAEGEFPHTDEAFAELLHPEDREAVFRAFTQAVETSSDYMIEFRCKNACGKWCPMEGRGRAAYNAQGVAQSLFGVVMDISERRDAEAQLRQLNERLSLADRRKDEFLATLAHELRNPMAPIRNVLEMLKLKNLRDPQLEWGIGALERQIQQMTHLVDDLMEVSRITQGRVDLRKQTLDFLELVQNAIEVVHPAIDEADHELHVDLPDEVIFVDADATRLTQIITNLVTNAAKYTPAGGHIHIRVKKQGQQVMLAVRDTGIGIPPQELTNVFRMFSQLTPALERSKGGLGIGLALVRGLVELHGGSIVADSAGTGKGSEFTVRLPLQERARAPLKPAQEFSVGARQARRILIVDDNVDAAESLALALSMLGDTTSTAHSGFDGLAKAEEFLPEVILLDIGLPDLNGYQVARRLRETSWGKEILLVAVTGWGQEKDKHLAQEAGFDRHMTKPVDFRELDALLKN